MPNDIVVIRSVRHKFLRNYRHVISSHFELARTCFFVTSAICYWLSSSSFSFSCLTTGLIGLALLVVLIIPESLGTKKGVQRVLLFSSRFQLHFDSIFWTKSYACLELNALVGRKPHAPIT